MDAVGVLMYTVERHNIGREHRMFCAQSLMREYFDDKVRRKTRSLLPIKIVSMPAYRDRRYAIPTFNPLKYPRLRAERTILTDGKSSSIEMSLSTSDSRDALSTITPKTRSDSSARKSDSSGWRVRSELLYPPIRRQAADDRQRQMYHESRMSLHPRSIPNSRFVWRVVRLFTGADLVRVSPRIR